MAGTQVGEFPEVGRKVRRSIPNPLDKATIVSIMPVPISEVKPSLFPGRFDLEVGSLKDPAILTIGPSFWYYQPPNDGPVMEINHSAVQMADSVIRDYCTGMLGCDMHDKRPGLFFIPGEVGKKTVLNTHYKELEVAEIKQKAWFVELVKLGDMLWATGNGNPLVIWDLMRIAARSLGMESKDWVKDMIAVEKVRCIGCGFLKDPAYPVCPGCKLIDQNHPIVKAGELKFAP